MNGNNGISSFKGRCNGNSGHAANFGHNGDSGYTGNSGYKGSPDRGAPLGVGLPPVTRALTPRRRAVATVSHRLAGVGIGGGAPRRNSPVANGRRVAP